jgi:hypothetical protein
MSRSKTPTISLDETKARFEEWRQNRKGKASIPEELSAAAVEVARKEGVLPVKVRNAGVHGPGGAERCQSGSSSAGFTRMNSLSHL